MKVKSIMTPNPVCCTPETRLQEVARMMVKYDCGSIPVVDNRVTLRPLGIVTDRDIACRTVAEGKNPLNMTAGECMSSPVIIVTPETDVTVCCRMMEKNLIRRIPVVNDTGECCGIVAQADIAAQAPEQTTARMIQAISRPLTATARVTLPQLSQRP